MSMPADYSPLNALIRFYLQQLEIVYGTASRNMHPFRKEMAKDILAGELQVLQSAHAWAANYCETVNMS
jgi:hypothetical protein